MGPSALRWEHLVVTRFNVRLRRGAEAPPAAWQRRRLELLAVAAPAMRRQTDPEFQWLVFADADAPDDVRRDLAAAGERHGFEVVELDQPFFVEHIVPHLLERVASGRTHLL